MKSIHFYIVLGLIALVSISAIPVLFADQEKKGLSNREMRNIAEFISRDIIAHMALSEPVQCVASCSCEERDNEKKKR